MVPGAARDNADGPLRQWPRYQQGRILHVAFYFCTTFVRYVRFGLVDVVLLKIRIYQHHRHHHYHLFAQSITLTISNKWVTMPKDSRAGQWGNSRARFWNIFVVLDFWLIRELNKLIIITNQSPLLHSQCAVLTNGLDCQCLGSEERSP